MNRVFFCYVTERHKLDEQNKTLPLKHGITVIKIFPTVILNIKIHIRVSSINGKKNIE